MDNTTMTPARMDTYVKDVLTPVVAGICSVYGCAKGAV